MIANASHRSARLINGWRVAGCGAALALLAIPAIAMRYTEEVNWTLGDFIAAAIMLLILGTALEIGVRVARGKSHLLGITIAALTGFFTIWANAAVGIIGNEAEPVNLGFDILVVAAAISSLAARFSPLAMAWITGIVALCQPALGIAALMLMPGHAVEWGVLAMFAALWGAAAFNLRMAAKHTSATQ